jgi:hypothetical protein
VSASRYPEHVVVIRPEAYGDGYYADLSVDTGHEEVEILSAFGDTPLDALKNVVEMVDESLALNSEDPLITALNQF